LIILRTSLADMCPSSLVLKKQNEPAKNGFFGAGHIKALVFSA